MTGLYFVADLLRYLSPRGVFREGRPVADLMMRTVTPSLFVVALYTRLLEAQLDAIAGSGQLARALRDVAAWGVGLLIYFSAGDLIVHYLNALYGAMARIGSLSLVATQMAALLTVANHGPSGLWATIKEVNALPLRLTTVFIYYTTLVVTTFLEVLLRIAQAIGYEFSFLYGLIALPLAVSRNFSLLRGFAKLMGFFVLWPIVQALLLAVFAPIFTHAVATLQGLLGRSDYMTVYAHMLFTILNLVLAAVLIAAPYVTAVLVENAGAGRSLVEPYLGRVTQGAAILDHATTSASVAAVRWYRDRDTDVLSVKPRRMPVLHIPSDPDYWPVSRDGRVPRTNYLKPDFDGPELSDDSDDFSRR